MEIPNEEIKYFKDTNIDEVGEVFVWNGKIFRGIYPESVYIVNEYFDSGFLNEIVTKGLFPKTIISEYTNPKFGLILEHEKISPNTVDVEWSFDMYKDAALLVVRIAQIAQRYGFNMKDCHTKNVLFHNNKPMFVDLGSFVKNKDTVHTFIPNAELKNYYYILRIWQKNFHYVARNLQHNYTVPEIECIMLIHPITRNFKWLLKKKITLEDKLYSLLLHTNKEVSSRIGRYAGVAIFVKKVLEKLKPFKCQKLDALEKTILNIKAFKDVNACQAREDISIPEFGQSILSGRNKVICINPYNEDFIKKISSFNKTNEILGIDVDEAKGNCNYNRYKSKEYNITNVIYNFYTPFNIIDSFKPAINRFVSDVFIIYRPEIIRNDTYIVLPLSSLFSAVKRYCFKHLLVVIHDSEPKLETVDYSTSFKIEQQEHKGSFCFYLLSKK